MILPSKHRRLENSTLGRGAMILAQLERPLSVSALWERLGKSRSVLTFLNYIEALDLLFALGAIDYSGGRLRRRS